MSFAIAMKSGALEAAIHQYKFQGKWGRGMVFARVLNGYLYENDRLLDPGAIVVPGPTYRHAGAGPRDDHTGWVIRQAAEEDDQDLPYLYDPPAIVKTQSTRKLKTLGTYERRVERDAIRRSLVVPDRGRVAGRTVWVYDDVFTTGITLDAVAEALKDAGAQEVYGLVLSRQPWS